MGKVQQIFLCFLVIATLNSFGQISHNREWKGLQLDKLGSKGYLELSAPDLLQAKKQDIVEDKIKNIAFRFGIPIVQEISFEQLSQRTIFQNGSAVRRMGISAGDARSLNLIFKSFELPAGGWMFIYSPENKQVLGAFTESNRHPDGQFSTSWIFNDSLIIEVYYPHYKLESEIELSHVVYGYRSFDKTAESFGDSGPCNINVACSEGQAWKDQKQSVVMILTSSNSRICSGAMINNVKEDGRPFMLTANHCPISTNNLFVFNYESPSCYPSKDSTITYTISGAQIRARNSKSDFALMELSSTPSPGFNVYYSGWNNTGEIAVTSACIHHPRGDVKKIAVDSKSSISSGYYLKGDDHWMIEYWDAGTTENASSGSPLFDHNRRITGQLHGGEASCSVPEGEDYFGKFSVSWDNDPNSIRQLKFWLDPDNTGASLMNGRSANETIGNFDVSLLGFTDLDIVQCGSLSFIPKVIVKNRGLQSLDSVQVDFYVNNVLQQSVVWSTPIASGNIVEVSGSAFNLNNGFYKLKAEASLPGQSDSDLSNNIVDLGFTNIAEPVTVEMIVQTDDYGDEFNWEILSSTGSLIVSKGDYSTITGGALYRDTLCLFDGCFTLKAMDGAGDGLCCNYGNGYYILRDLITGDTIIKNFAFNSTDTSHNFCLGDSCSIMARARIRESSSSTAADGEIHLEMLSGNPPFIFDWSNGKSTQDIINLLPGVYSVLITDGLNCTDSLFYQLGIATGLKSELSREVINLRIFPNPSKSEIQLKGLKQSVLYEIRIIDLSGRQITKKTLVGNQHGNQLNLTSLENGMYILNLSSPDDHQSLKLLIRK